MIDSFWNSHYKDFGVQEPSRFATYCINKYLNENNLVVELGCGNGRDGFALFKKTGRYVGVDSCPIAVKGLSQKLESVGKDVDSNLRIICADFTKIDFENLSTSNEKLYIYSRFSYHSIDYIHAEDLLRSLNNLKRPWMMLMEVRTIYDELYGEGTRLGLHEFQTDHYRRFIDPEKFILDNMKRFSFKYFEVARDFAPFKQENPIIMRTIFQSKESDFE